MKSLQVCWNPESSDNPLSYTSSFIQPPFNSLSLCLHLFMGINLILNASGLPHINSMKVLCKLKVCDGSLFKEVCPEFVCLLRVFHPPNSCQPHPHTQTNKDLEHSQEHKSRAGLHDRHGTSAGEQHPQQGMSVREAFWRKYDLGQVLKPGVTVSSSPKGLWASSRAGASKGPSSKHRAGKAKKRRGGWIQKGLG